MKNEKKSLALVIIFAMLLTSATVFAETYTVKKGNTLWSIGKKYNVEWEKIAELNGVKDVRKLQIGTVLEIPSDEKPDIEEPTEPEEPINELFTETTVLIKNGDYEIPSVITIPKGAGDFPAVVMLHGTGSDKNEAGNGYVLAAAELAKAGIASIRIDFIGNGDSKEDYINYNFTTAVSDANAAFDYISKLDNIDSKRIGIMGWSQGGTIAMLAASQNRSLQSILTLAGSPDLSTMLSKENYETAKANGFYTMDFGWRPSLKVGLKWFQDVYSTDVLKELSYTNAPILAINGKDDDVVEPINARKIVEASSNKDSKELILEGADHTFNIFSGDMTAFNELTASTVEWFKDTLVPVYSIENVKITNGERDIPAIVVSPVGEGPFPAVVMNHGHGGSKEENGGFLGIARELAKKGILAISMDFPGTGESTEPFTENYISNMVSDSNASLEYILNNYNVDKDRLGILGYSMGGRIALTIGKEKDSPYKAMGLLAPSADWGEEMMIGFLGGQEEYDLLYKEAQSEKGYADFTTVFGQKQTLSKQWFDEMIESNPIKDISKFEGKMMVVYGEQDVIVTAAINEAVLSAFPSAEKVLVEDADHGYGFYSNQPSVTATVEDSLANFFESNLK